MGLPPEHKDVAIHQFFPWENKEQPDQNFLNLPISYLGSLWATTTTDNEWNDEAAATSAMAHLDSTLRNMRASYTVQAIERAALNVSISLLALVCFEQCSNPFLCLAQASMFASQGPKLGTSDRYYQARLPLLHLCTERQALTILGRADCLRAIHFYREAAFVSLPCCGL